MMGELYPIQMFYQDHEGALLPTLEHCTDKEEHCKPCHADGETVAGRKMFILPKGLGQSKVP